jgi:Transposase
MAGAGGCAVQAGASEPRNCHHDDGAGGHSRAHGRTRITQICAHSGDTVTPRSPMQNGSSASVLACLPAQRRTADSIQTQMRRRQARSHPLAVLGRPLPHSRIHRTREKIRRHLTSIYATLDHGLSNGLIESVNTKIRVITRMPSGSTTATCAASRWPCRMWRRSRAAASTSGWPARGSSGPIPSGDRVSRGSSGPISRCCSSVMRPRSRLCFLASPGSSSPRLARTAGRW